MSNLDLERSLTELPDKVAEALIKWRTSTLDRERVEALLYTSIKGKDNEMTATEIRANIHLDPNRYDAVLHEIKAEANYTMLLEKLLCAKKLASLRVAF